MEFPILFSYIPWGHQIGVASYDNVRMKEVQAQLPTEEQIRQRIEQAEEEFRMNERK